MSVRPLPISTPAAESVDATGISAFVDAMDGADAVDPHSLMILRNGQVIASGWWAPYSPGRPHLLYSLSKSFTSTALGFAVAEGLLGLDDPVVDYFPQFQSDITEPSSRSIMVRHLAAMASGHVVDTWSQAVAIDPGEPVRGFLLLAPDRAPGTVFAYNQSATYTLAAIIQQVSGQTLTEYLRPRLFDPLGVGPVSWQRHPAGRDLGYTGLHATTDAIARLGQLYLQRGAWQGQQLLTEAWIDEATRSHIETRGEPNPDWRQGYGFQFWKSRHGYRGDGAYGQFCLILPEQDAVIAITAATLDMQLVLDAVWEHLLPAFVATPALGADADLARRLSDLELPPLPLGPSPDSRDAWLDVNFAPAGGMCSEQPSLIGIGVAEDADGWHVTLREAESRLRLLLGTGRWEVSDAGSIKEDGAPTAVSGGWTGHDSLRFDVIFLETPHRLAVKCALDAHTFEAHWTTGPLNPTELRNMRSRRPS